MHDLVIRGATVIDGLGHDPVRADVAVKDGRVAAIGEIKDAAERVVDAGGLSLMPGIVDLHTHYDAQITWDSTLSPSPSLGVTTAVLGNCGFGIVPSPPPLRDLIMRNLAVVEGMDIDALRAGIDWRFESFPEYMDAVRRRPAYANVAVMVGHSAVRTAVLGDEASTRKQPTDSELAEMKRLVSEAMAAGAIGLGASYSLNHSGWGGVPMPSTISDLSGTGRAGRGDGAARPRRYRACLGARRTCRGDRGAGGAPRPAVLPRHRGRHVQRASAGAGARRVRGLRRGAGARQWGACPDPRCQALSFDFTLANAYPFYAHPTFDPVKAYLPEQLKPVLRDASYREILREDLRHPRLGTMFQGNWDRILVAAPAKPENAGLANRDIADIARASAAATRSTWPSTSASTRICRQHFSGASSTRSTTASRPCSSTRRVLWRCRTPGRI